MPSRQTRASARIARRIVGGRKLRVEKSSRKPRKVLLGNGSSNNIYAGAGLVWARNLGGTDDDGNTLTQTPYKVRYDGSVAYFHQADRKVWIKPDYDGEWSIDRTDWVDANDSGNDTMSLNFAHPANSELKLKNAKRFMARPVNSAPPGTEVFTRGIIYLDSYGNLQTKNAGEAATTIDLASYIPATGFERLALVCLRAVDNSFQVFASTAQALGTGFTLADYQECLDQSIHNEDMPGQAFILSDAQEVIQMIDGDLAEDLRQFMNQRPALGFPSTVSHNTLIREGQNVTVIGDVTVDTGKTLTVAGTLTVWKPPLDMNLNHLYAKYDITSGNIVIADQGYVMGERSTDPVNLTEGNTAVWKSDGTATGDDGDVLVRDVSGGTTTTRALNWKDFTPSSVTLNTGTSSSVIADAQVMFDGNTYDIAEVTGVPGFDAEFNFTGLDRCVTMAVARWQYDGSATHFVTIDMYNYNTTTWDELRVFSNSNAWFASMTMYIPLVNQPNYVDGSGNAMIRFYHRTSGNASHDIHIDYVGITHGLQGVL